MTPANLSAPLLEICRHTWIALAPAVGNHLWQSTLFAAAAGLLTLILRKEQARVRYWLWLAASAKFLIPFSVLVTLGNRLASSQTAAGTNAGLYFAVEEISQPFRQSAIALPAASQAVNTFAAPSVFNFLPTLLVAVWLCGFAAVVMVWCTRWRKVSAVVRKGIHMLEGREVEALRRVERRSNSRPIAIVRSRDSLEPGIFGIVRPVLLWPEGISNHLEDAHLEAILAHEVWHVRRRDNLAAALHMLVEAVFWFHPLVWWLGARMVEAREHACDEEVVALSSDRHIYAESILKVCEFCVGSPLACVSGVTGSDLKKRMVHIMTESIATKLNFGKKLLLGTAGTLAIALPIVFGLANAPQVRAQDQAQAANAPVITNDVELTVKPGADGVSHRVAMMYSPTGFKSTNTTLQALIQEAYGVQANQIAGAPDWAKTAQFDLEIGPNDDKSTPRGVSIEHSLEQSRVRNQRLLQVALAERFKLALHSETRELSTYALVVSDDGSKLQPSKPASSHSEPVKSPEGIPLDRSFRIKLDGSQAGLEARGMSTSDIASHLARQLGTVVVDKTGLTGNYDFALNWKSDASGGGNFNSPLSDASASSLLTALQDQLGLKLEPQTAPMQVLVIDHAERPADPTQN
jgi:bla regulator protein BlaR1